MPKEFKIPSLRNIASIQEHVLEQAQPIEEPREFSFPSFRCPPSIQELIIEQVYCYKQAQSTCCMLDQFQKEVPPRYEVPSATQGESSKSSN